MSWAVFPTTSVSLQKCYQVSMVEEESQGCLQLLYVWPGNQVCARHKTVMVRQLQGQLLPG
jgi:hypothetical protein